MNGYAFTDAGLLVRRDALAAEAPGDYTPANAELDTIPHGIAPVTSENTEPTDEEHEHQVADEEGGEQGGTAASGRGGLWRQWQHRREQGQTRAVTRRRRGTAEARELAEITSPAVVDGQRKLDEAEALERLDSDPRAESRSNRSTRRWVLRLAGGAIAAGVLVSSSTAQATVTAMLGWSADSSPFGYYAAYLVDPMLGALLFSLLFTQSLASNRGVALDGESRVFRQVETTLFGLVAVLNGGPSLAAVFSQIGSLAFGDGGSVAELGRAVMVLVIHLIGPGLVGLGVYAMPSLLAVLSRIAAATSAKLAGEQNPSEQEQPASSEIDEERARALLEVVRPAVEAGQCRTGAGGIGSYLRGQGYRVGAPVCQWIRDALKREGAAA